MFGVVCSGFSAGSQAGPVYPEAPGNVEVSRQGLAHLVVGCGPLGGHGSYGRAIVVQMLLNLDASLTCRVTVLSGPAVAVWSNSPVSLPIGAKEQALIAAGPSGAQINVIIVKNFDVSGGVLDPDGGGGALTDPGMGAAHETVIAIEGTARSSRMRSDTPSAPGTPAPTRSHAALVPTMSPTRSM